MENSIVLTKIIDLSQKRIKYFVTTQVCSFNFGNPSRIARGKKYSRIVYYL